MDTRTHFSTKPIGVLGATILACMVGTCLMGCETIRGAAGQNTFAKFTADGDLEISGDGTADFDVLAEGNDEGWKLTLKTKTSREAVQGAAGVAMEGFRAITALTERVQIPGIVGPPAPATPTNTPDGGP